MSDDESCAPAGGVPEEPEPQGTAPEGLEAQAPSSEEPEAPAQDEDAGERGAAAPAAVPARPDRPLVRAGLRGFLEIDRKDLWYMLWLTLLALTLRVASPIIPGFLAHPGSGAQVSVYGVGHAFNGSACQQAPVGPGGGEQTVCGQIFDEVYFPTDAANDMHQPAITYFDPEPPLTKLLMTSSIRVFGFDTWGWRMAQVLFGSLLVTLIYLIARRLRRDRFFAATASLFVALDGLAFVESRIGVIDIIAVFFAALLWYAFLLHWQARTRTQWRVTLWVMAAVAGLAFAAKLTALAPTVVIAALVVVRGIAPWLGHAIPQLWRIAGPRRAEAVLWREAAGPRAPLYYGVAILLVFVIFSASFSRYLTIAHDDVYVFTGCDPSVPGLTTATPATEHLPVPVMNVAGHAVPDPVQAVRNIVAIEAAGLRYHSLECHGHPYASRWYTWPLMVRPVLMYASTDPQMDGSGSGLASITDMGNPALWWIGIFALLFCAWRMLAGPWEFRLLVSVIGAASLYVMVVTFLAAEPPVDPTTHVAPGPIQHLSPFFYAGFLGMVIYCAIAAVSAVVTRRFVPAFIVLGYLTSWMMWVPGNEKRVLFFYHALGMLLFLALGAAYACVALRRANVVIAGRRFSLAPVAWAWIGLVVAAFVFFYPIWTAIPQTGPNHDMRVWVDSW